jgi:ribosomal protein L22
MAEEKKDTAKKPAAKKPAAKKAPAKKAAATKKPAAAKKPAAKKPAAKKAAAKKAAATKPAAAKKAAAKAKPKAGERPVVKARASYVRIAPRKARLIANQVRGLPIEDARTLLRFSPRGVARDIAKLIESAAANAENNHDLVADDLRVTEISVDEGPTLRRYRPRALGRATRINKRTCHIKVALTPED